MAVNTKGLISPQPLPLEKECFASEQERLDYFCRAMRLPVEAGESIKGDKGETGPQGPRGEKGEQGAAAEIETTTFNLIANSAFFDYNGDHIGTFFQIMLDDQSPSEPAYTPVWITYFRRVAGITRIYFDKPIPGDFFRLIVTRLK